MLQSFLQKHSYSYKLATVCFQSGVIPQKVFIAFGNVSHVYLIRGLQKYAKNLIFTMAFWATCKKVQPIQPIQQQHFTLSWSAFKRPSWWYLNFLHIFAIHQAWSAHHQHFDTINLQNLMVYLHSQYIWINKQTQFYKKIIDLSF